MRYPEAACIENFSEMAFMGYRVSVHSHVGDGNATDEYFETGRVPSTSEVL